MIGGKRRTAFQSILVGYDGSQQAEKAAEAAISLANALDAKLTIVAVARPPEPAVSVELEAMLDNAREHFEHDFMRLAERARRCELGIETEILVGHPAEQIIHKAETMKADLVVLGHRGTSMFHKWIMGSISEKVLKHAHCPVMVVR